jgi:hypothetical protein
MPEPMIYEAVNFVKDKLSEYIGADSQGEPLVQYIDLNVDPPAFRSVVNVLLINLEEETSLRPANRYLYTESETVKYKSTPPLRLNLYLLFACKPKQKTDSNNFNYDTSLNALSQVAQFFQQHHVFNEDLDGSDSKIIMELHPLTYAQQNEVWSSLKTAYLPSLCYKLKMIVILKKPSEPLETIDSSDIQIGHLQKTE